MTRLVAVLLLIVATAAAALAAEPDPRVVAADALLGDADAFPRAIALYREALADGPDDPAVRLRLARVLAWSQRYDEALAEYDRLLAASDEPPPGSAAGEIEVERAEVLSWAGRSAEAIAAFDAALARDPGDARAARGLARTYRWSGRNAPADRAYARALALEEDPEARAEWNELQAAFPRRSDAQAELYADSEDFRELRSTASASFFLDLDTQIEGRAGWIDLRGPGVAAAPWLERKDRGGEVALAARRALGERVRAEVEVGARVFREAGGFPLVRGRLELTPSAGTALGVEIDHRDALDRTDSVAALEDGLRDTTARVTLWKGLPRRFEVFVDAQLGHLSDSNLRSGASATLSWQPWKERELRLVAGGGYLGYTRRSDLYYDPDWDGSGFVGFTHRQPLPLRFSADLEARGGWGSALQDGVRGRGPAYEVAGSLSWRVGIVRVALRASRAQSQRESSYVANRLFATVGLDLGR